jgi:hypothetical protein
MVTVVQWWRCWQVRQELSVLEEADVEALARDIGIAPDRLVLLVARGPRGGEELHRYLYAVGFKSDQVERIHSGIMREMSIVCSGCNSTSRCRRDIDDGWAPIVQQYCPNAETIETLQAERYRAEA